MSVRAEHWRRLVAVGLTSVLMVLGLVTFVPSASASPTDASKTGLCWYRQWFGGKHYCPADTPGVLSTRYGTGRRVYLDALIVVDTSADSLTFISPQGCDSVHCASAVYLTVPWKGTHRPIIDGSGPYTRSSVRIYGTTTTGTLIPAGYVTTGGCYYEPVCGD